IDLRRRTARRSGTKNPKGGVPAGVLSLHEDLGKAAAQEGWKERDARKKRVGAEDPDNWYGVGFAICQKDFGTGAAAPVPKSFWQMAKPTPYQLSGSSAPTRFLRASRSFQPSWAAALPRSSCRLRTPAGTPPLGFFVPERRAVRRRRSM
ncbi:hypothetical protein LJG51_33290, partial [Pseudomonas aeruginosa]